MEERTDLRVRRTRKLLIDAFADLIAEKPFRRITVREIADHAMVNRATFYAHFEDKYDMLNHFIHEQFVRSIARRRERKAVADDRSFHELFIAMIESLADVVDIVHPDRGIELSVLARVRQEINAVVLDFVSRSVAHADDPAVRTAAAVIGWAVYGAAVDWSRVRNVTHPRVVAANVLAVISRGLPWLIEGTTPREAAAPGAP